MPITVTPRATQEVLRIMEDQQLDPKETYLRVSVAAGGCSGFSYKLDFLKKEEVEDIDEEFKFGDLTAVVDAKSDIYLDGTVVDFHEDLDRRGFKFENPQATGGCCGCGTSFRP
jgi:iron-sulfur cluster assembly protein